MGLVAKWRQRRRDKDIERIQHWIQTGQSDYDMGVPPNQGPFKYHTRAYIWWICGWTIGWELDNEETDRTST
jgi:hypothetical protein